MHSIAEVKQKKRICPPKLDRNSPAIELIVAIRGRLIAWLRWVLIEIS